MSFSVGIIGLPNVGKSTLFKALTKKQVNISNYPFCTIDPNVGIVKVPDERLDRLSKILHPEQTLPTHIEFIDIAGLVKGAHEGQGLGNQFLSHIREADALVEVVRDFSDPEVSHITGKINPDSDIETIKLELIFADLFSIENRLEKIQKEVKNEDKQTLKLFETLKKIKTALNRGLTITEANLPEDEEPLLKNLNLLTAKPIVYVINIDENKIKERRSTNNRQIYLCAKLESELIDLPEDEIREYLKGYGQSRSALDTLIISSYKLLNLITFFTCQNQILQAWTIPQKTKVSKAAEKIHTDMARGFIKAEVTGWQHLADKGTEHGVREAGLMRTEGKEYEVQDGDVIHFKFSI